VEARSAAAGAGDAGHLTEAAAEKLTLEQIFLRIVGSAPGGGQELSWLG